MKNPNLENLTKNWLEEKYLKEKLNTRQISKLLYAGKTSVIRYLKKYNIPLRPERKNIRKPYHNKEWLYKKYIIEKLSTSKIAILCGLKPSSCGQISKYLKNFNIKMRNASERYLISHTEESIKKLSDAKKKNIGWHHSKNTKEKIRNAQIGEKSHNWKGGYYSQRSGSAWWRLRKKILERDAQCCQSCGNTVKLDIHHKIPFRCFKNPKDANNPDNLITLCRKCHIIHESQLKFVNTKIGKNFKTYPFVNIFHSDIGDNVTIKSFCNIGRSKIGDNVNIQAGVSMSQTDVGNNVFIGPQTAILDDKYPPTRNPKNPVIIEDDAIIGGGVILIPGVKIGKKAVVGAGSVITKDVPTETVIITESKRRIVMTRAEYDRRQNELKER